MVDLVLRPSAIDPERPWALQLRWHESIGPTEYFTLRHVSNHLADEIMRAGAPRYLYEEKEDEGEDLHAVIRSQREEIASLKATLSSYSADLSKITAVTITGDLDEELLKLIGEAKERYDVMPLDEREKMHSLQRESFVRGMTTPCEHGVLDFEQCAECRKSGGDA